MKKYKVAESKTLFFGYEIYVRRWLFFWRSTGLYFSNLDHALMELVLLEEAS